jgi:hypothetical protein
MLPRFGMRRHKPRMVALVGLAVVAALPVYLFAARAIEPASTRDWSRTGDAALVGPADELPPDALSAAAQGPGRAPAMLGLPTPRARPTTKPKPLLTVDGKTLMLDGKPAFVLGVNYPGRSNQDFGDGGWGHSGVSNPTTTAEVDADFANMAAQGVRIVKWDVFDDGRYSPKFNAQGQVTGVDDMFLEDLDAAIDLAEQHDMYLVLSLFSDRFWTTRQTANGVALGGHAASLSEPSLRASLVEKAIVPMLQHLAFTDRVLAYEIVNLPEFGVQELNKDNDGRIRVPLADAQAFVKDVVAAIHANTVALATLESNRATNMQQWRGLGLDFYSFQWADWQEPYEPLGTDASKFALDRPAIVEVPAAGSQAHALGQALELVKQHGYGGVLAASYLMPTGKASWADGASAFAGWAQQHWGDMSLTSRNAPGEAVAFKPLPFSVEDVTFSASGSALTADMHVNIQQNGSYAIQLLCFPEGAKDPVALDDRVGLFQPGDQQEIQLRLLLDDLKEGQPYKLSVGIFSTEAGDWKLTKWVDRLALLTIRDGKPNALTGAAMQEALARLTPGDKVSPPKS